MSGRLIQPRRNLGRLGCNEQQLLDTDWVGHICLVLEGKEEGLQHTGATAAVAVTSLQKDQQAQAESRIAKPQWGQAQAALTIPSLRRLWLVAPRAVHGSLGCSTMAKKRPFGSS